MSGIPTRSLAQLPIATSISTNDTTVIQQSGITKSTTVGNLLASISTGVPSVLGYAALRSLYDSSTTVSAGFTVFVRGVNAVGFGEGFFYYDNVATSSDNGGTVIVDNVGRRWLRVMDDIIDVKWFGAVGNGVVDDRDAIQSAINVAEDSTTRGNTVLLSSCSSAYLLSSGGLVVGNGTPTGTFSTKSPITIRGQGAVSGIGAFNPTGGGAIRSAVSGAALTIQGPLIGWNVNNVFISFSTSNANSDGIKIIEAQYGNMEAVTIVSPPRVGIHTTTYGNNNVTNNTFNNVNIYLPTWTSLATGVYLSGTGSNNTAHNEWTGLHVLPTAENQKCLHLGFCDANHFNGYVTNFQSDAAGIHLDYTDGTNNFPSANTFYSPDLHNTRITTAGSISDYARANPNRITNLLQINGTRIPQGVQGLAVDKLTLASDQTFYVSPVSGSDTTHYGLVPSSAWATLQFGYETIANYYDLNGYTATLRAADGTYSVGLSAGTPLTGGPFRLKFNGSGAVVNTASAPILKFTNGVQATVSNGSLTGVGSCIDVDNGAYVRYGGQVFGSVDMDHVRAQNGGIAEQIAGTVFITGTAQSHIHVLSNGVINTSGRTIHALTSVTFTDSFAKAESGGMINSTGNTFTNGTWFAGRRFNLSGFGSVNTNNAGGSYFPGTINGVNYNPLNMVLGQSAIQVSVGASTTETILAAIPVSAGIMGPNGRITGWIDGTVTASANLKHLRVRFGNTGITSTVMVSNAMTTTAPYFVLPFDIQNRNATNSQRSSSFGRRPGDTVMELEEPYTGTVDTTVSCNLYITGEKASAGETIQIESYYVDLTRSPADGTYS